MTAFPVVNCILCRCHGEIGDIVSFNRLQRQLAGDDRVASVEICDALCLGDILANLARRMQADNGTRLLIAGCSPLARGEDLIDRLEADGVDPARVMVTDIREGCAWIHAAQSEAATAKAADLIRMGITALRYREAPPDIDIAVCQRVLVMGGGPAGLAAAAALGRAGVAVTLVEATGRLGGMLNYLGWVAPTNQGADAMREPLVEAIQNDPHIQVHLGTRVAELSGSAGNFEARLSGKNGETHLTAGAVIVATGAKPRLSRGIYRYGELPGVISGMEMEKAFRDGGPIGGDTVFIQCVNVRNQERSYCSAVCCPAALKNAIRLKEGDPGMAVTILHRDIMSPGRQLEALYRRATAAGVLFIRFDPQEPPRIEGRDKVTGVTVADALSGRERSIAAQRVVLSTPLEPRENRALPLPAERHGFYWVQPFLHTVETTAPGLFVCGAARWPVMAEGAMTQGRAAAAKALHLVSRPVCQASRLIGFQKARAACARVLPETCTGCGNCVAVCPFEACRLEQTPTGWRAAVDPVRCMGCGSCTAACPNQSAVLSASGSPAMARLVVDAFAGRQDGRPCRTTQGSVADQ